MRIKTQKVFSYKCLETGMCDRTPEVSRRALAVTINRHPGIRGVSLTNKKYWNNGYMTEACKCLLNYLFSNGYTEVKIDAMVENIGSNRVIQKCGGIFVKTENVFRPLKNSNVLVNRYIVNAER